MKPELTDLPKADRLAAQIARSAACAPPWDDDRTQPEDLLAIRHRIVTGLPMAPLAVWRW